MRRILRLYTSFTDTLLHSYGADGDETDFNHLDSALIVVGGSGLTAGTSRLAAFARAEVSGKLKVAKIVFVWTVRDYRALYCPRS